MTGPQQTAYEALLPTRPWPRPLCFIHLLPELVPPRLLLLNQGWSSWASHPVSSTNGLEILHELLVLQSACLQILCRYCCHFEHLLYVRLNLSSILQRFTICPPSRPSTPSLCRQALSELGPAFPLLPACLTQDEQTEWLCHSSYAPMQNQILKIS